MDDFPHGILAAWSFPQPPRSPSSSPASSTSAAGRLTFLQNQVAAGSEMWVLNSAMFLIPVAVLTVRRLTPKHLLDAHRVSSPSRPFAQP